MQIIIVRHGETRENRSGIVQGHILGTLNANGKRQLKALARKLTKYKIDIAFSSDLERTVNTTRAVMKYHNAPVYLIKGLRERHPGIFHGRTRKEFREDERKSGLGKARFRPSGGESLADVEKRVKKFAMLLPRKHRNSTVLIVTHGMVIKCLASIYLHIPLGTAAELRTKNAGILIINVDHGRGTVVKDSMFKNPGAILASNKNR